MTILDITLTDLQAAYRAIAGIPRTEGSVLLGKYAGTVDGHIGRIVAIRCLEGEPDDRVTLDNLGPEIRLAQIVTIGDTPEECRVLSTVLPDKAERRAA